MIWRNPVAWFGLATLLIPIAIHLLVRHRAEPRPFPSLRFVQPTRLASVRRKMISDWPLLVIRLAILAAAVAALADPLWQSAARRAEWNTRQARAIVIDTTPSVADAGGANASAATEGAADAAAGTEKPGAAAAIAQREAEGAFIAEMLGSKQLADGIRRATDWLRTAPPGRRELVVISDFQLGAVDAAMLRDVPPHVGIRLVRTPGAPATRTVDGHPRTQRAAANAAGASAFTLRNPRVTLNANETAVTWVDAASPSTIGIDDAIDAATPTPNRKSNVADITLRPFDLKIRGSATDRSHLRAAAEAVIAQGVPLAAPGAGGVRNAATIIIADAAPGPNDAGAFLAQWQVDAARAIATDTSLARAIGRATTANTTLTTGPATVSSAAPPAAFSAPTPAKADSPATHSATATTASTAAAGPATVPSPEAAAKSRKAFRAAGGVPGPWTALMRGIGAQPAVLVAANTSMTAQEVTASSPTSGPSSVEATAKSRTASNTQSDAPAPWIVLMRDAGGRPAVLAAADGAHRETRMLVWSRVAAADEATALLIRATLRALAGVDAFGEAEVIAIPDATLAQWQRPASEPPASEWRDVDGGQRRWLWGAVLVLLVVEQVLRRRARHAEARPDRKVYEDAA